MTFKFSDWRNDEGVEPSRISKFSDLVTPRVRIVRSAFNFQNKERRNIQIFEFRSMIGGNGGDGVSVTDDQLMSCTYKFCGKDVPLVRKCPFCEDICLHNEAMCKHTQCAKEGCGKWFCHICLRPNTVLGWTCGGSGSLCRPNDRSTNKEGEFINEHGIFEIQSNENKRVWKLN